MSFYNRVLRSFQQQKNDMTKALQKRRKKGLSLTINPDFELEYPFYADWGEENHNWLIGMLKKAHIFELPENGIFTDRDYDPAKKDVKCEKLVGAHLPFEVCWLEWKHTYWGLKGKEQVSVPELGVLLWETTNQKLMNVLGGLNLCYKPYSDRIKMLGEIIQKENAFNHRVLVMIPITINNYNESPDVSPQYRAQIGAYVSSAQAVVYGNLDDPLIITKDLNEEKKKNLRMKIEAGLRLVRATDSEEEIQQEVEKRMNFELQRKYTLTQYVAPVGAFTFYHQKGRPTQEYLNGEMNVLMRELETFKDLETRRDHYNNFMLGYLGLQSTQDSGNEMEAVLDFMGMLQCRNIDVVKAYSQSKIRKFPAPVRESKGRTHKLIIKGNEKQVRYVYDRDDDAPKRGVRTHWRRGHIRRYSNGLTTFIPATIVKPLQGQEPNRQSYQVTT